MRILYVTPLWSGLKPFFFSGELKAKGMPAFFKVFEFLLKDKRVESIHVLLFIANDNRIISIPPQYDKKLIVHPIYTKGRLSLYIGLLKAILKGRKLIISNEINVVYGHGTISFISSILGRICKIENYRRIYGTFLFRKVKSNKNILWTNFLEYLSFRLRGNGLIITNDGTHGDKVYNYINQSKNIPLYYLLNGVDKENKINYNNEAIHKSIFTYVARVDKWKRQHLLIEALNILKLQNIELPLVYIIGHIFDISYKEYLTTLIKEYKLEEVVKILGPVNYEEVKEYYSMSIVTFSLYDFSNLGNVFIESLTNGVPVIAINEDDSLNYFPSNTYISVDQSSESIALVIKNILNKTVDLSQVSSNAQNFALQNILTWEERVAQEVNIIFGNEKK